MQFLGRVCTVHVFMIAKNNYDGSDDELYKYFVRDGKIDYYIKFSLPDDDVMLEKCNAGDRDIYLYKGDLDLRNYKHSF